MNPILSPLKLGATLVVLILMSQAFAQTGSEPNADKTLSPYFLIKSDDPGLDQFPLRETGAQVDIAGAVANVTVTQVYENKGSKAIEAVYVFPASTRAAVFALTMTIGERTIVARIRERDQARIEYQQALEQGKSAALLEQQRPNVFQMNVGNIMPGDIIRVEMKYTETLVPENGIYEFVYPTVVGPRYSNAPAQEAPSSEQWIANPYLEQGNPAPYQFTMGARISSPIPLREVMSPSHDVNVDYRNRFNAAVSLKQGGSEGGNRDFVLRFRMAGNEVESGVLVFNDGKEKYFLAMIEGPTAPRPDQIPPREYVFIVDVSGSMYGFPLDISKKLLKDLIGDLRPADRFNVILFAGASSLWSPESKSATSQNVAEAIRFIEQQKGGGGTELLSALSKALALPAAEGFARTFVIATDGYVSVEKESFDLIRNNLSKANFFAFGIGSSVNRYIIEGIAKVGRGESFIVLNQGEAPRMADKFRKYIEAPVLTNISLKAEGLEVYDLEPQQIPDVFAQRPVYVAGKFKGEGRLVLEGRNGAGQYRQELTLSDAAGVDLNRALPYLWARERIARLDDYSPGDVNKQEVTNLGLNYNLLTRFTSFVAIDSEVRNPDGTPVTVDQPLPLPQGVSNLAVGGAAASYGWTGAAQSVQGVYSVQNAPVSYQRSQSLSEVVVVMEDRESMPSPKNEEFFMVVEEMPAFIGGEAAMLEFFRKNLRYPAGAQVSGKVYVEFVVKSDGSVSNVKVVRGLSGGCSEEAMRVVKLTSGMWTPGKQRGKAVSVKMVIPIDFQPNR